MIGSLISRQYITALLLFGQLRSLSGGANIIIVSSQETLAAQMEKIKSVETYRITSSMNAPEIYIEPKSRLKSWEHWTDRKRFKKHR